MVSQHQSCLVRKVVGNQQKPPQHPPTDQQIQCKVIDCLAIVQELRISECVSAMI